ncbi:MAG: transglutaminase domain-containing protein [Bacteroidota bacterium]
MKQKLLILLFSGLFISSVSAQHFITDITIRNAVDKKLEQRKKQFPSINFEISQVIPQKIGQRELEALKFLYAYMSLNDLVDKTPAYYLRQVEVAFQAQQTFSWGKQIPEVIFRHFVLPPRVNNEDLDTARILFFEEIKPRIEKLTMYQAALEVNHWCHEKMAYRGADERTSSPLASMLTALGRCGEESTFAVTALRAVCIPARQCYTPRWAHTDDNHAWVEVWIDGKWYFLGACEPEPELNMGWFAQPAKRTMMVHTNVFGPYVGNEEVLLRDQNFTKINLIQNYATTKAIHVKVLNQNKSVSTNTIVNFKLYNYAEFYTIATQKTDRNGMVSLTTGLGDLLVWATDEKSFGFQKITVADVDTVTITLNNLVPILNTQDFEVIPPINKQLSPTSSDKTKGNSIRLQYEDSVRTIYINTFINRKASDNLATKTGLMADTVWYYLHKSEGNWREISLFISQNASNPLLLTFLSTLADKDLRDVKEKTLTSHISNINNSVLLHKEIPYTVFVEGVVSTRICNEQITDWRNYFIYNFTSIKRAHFSEIPTLVKNYLTKNINIVDENYSRCPISPEGVFTLQNADIHSLNLCFVAICRSFGAPSRIDPATRIPQYYSFGKWIDVFFNQSENNTNSNSVLVLENDAKNIVKPEYYTHFTLSRFQNGEFVTLDYENSPLVKTFPATLHLESGYYQIITGNRQNDGSVLVKTRVFELKPNETTQLKIQIREPITSFLKKQTLEFNQTLTTSDNLPFNLQKSIQEKGIVILIIDPAKEPTRHVLNDIRNLKEEFEYWGGKILIVVPQSTLTSAFVADKTGLPSNTSFATDYNNELVKYIKSKLQITDDYPITLLLNPKEELLFQSTGYRIGIGEIMLKNIQIDQNSCKKP